MADPSFEEIEEIIEFRLTQVIELLNEIEYELNTCTPRELYDYLSAGSFKDSNITFRDRLGNEYLFLHSIIEISALKDAGVAINNKTIKNSPKETIYSAHLKAADYELGYSLILEDYYWLKHRLAQLKDDLENDEHMPEEHRKKAAEIIESFNDYRDY